jgi:hypothetical protein
MQRLAFFTAVAFMLWGAAILGCGKSDGTAGNTPAGTSPADDHADHDHDHDHAHEHAAHGPNGGHLIEIDGGRYHAEWTHDDPTENENAKNVTVYILGEDAKTEHPIEAESVQINVAIEGKDPKQYELPSLNMQDGKASQFALDDPALIVDLGMAGEGVTARLNLHIDGNPYSALIEHHEHDHHH